MRGTVGFRLRVRRVEAKEKMSQDKSETTISRIVEELRKPGPYSNDGLASRMAGVNGLEREAK